MDCNNGVLYPREIAFATTKKNVYILRIPPKESCRRTKRDEDNTKSRFFSKHKFYNSKNERSLPTIKPIAEYELHANNWKIELRKFVSDTFPGDVELRVHGGFQKRFFKKNCGFENVSKVFLKPEIDVADCDHEHCCKTFNFPCPGIEVGTMANYHNVIMYDYISCM